MNELSPHLKYKPCPEIVRTHEKWQSQLRQTASQLQSMGHVRAPEAIAATVMPLFVHLDAMFTLLQADLATYSEQVMALSQAEDSIQVSVGLHPQDAEMFAELIDQIYEVVEKVAKGLKEGSKPREQLDDARQMLADLQEGIMSAALEEDEVPPEDEAPQPAAPAAEPASPPVTPEAGALSDEPLQIDG